MFLILGWTFPFSHIIFMEEAEIKHTASVRVLIISNVSTYISPPWGLHVLGSTLSLLIIWKLLAFSEGCLFFVILWLLCLTWECLNEMGNGSFFFFFRDPYSINYISTTYSMLSPVLYVILLIDSLLWGEINSCTVQHRNASALEAFLMESILLHFFYYT